MSLEQLESFVAIAEEGTIGRAARRLHISQPPLRRRLKSLEEELGTPLFERNARGVQLLPRGRQLLTHARRILRAVDAAVAELQQPDEGAADRPGSSASGLAS